MRTDALTAEKIGSLYFDENTILEVEQKGGGGSGVAGVDGVTGGLAARNLMTGESTAEVIEDQGETITEQAATIEEQAAEIDRLEEELESAITIPQSRLKLSINNNTGQELTIALSHATAISPSVLLSGDLLILPSGSNLRQVQVITKNNSLYYGIQVLGNFIGELTEPITGVTITNNVTATTTDIRLVITSEFDFANNISIRINTNE